MAYALMTLFMASIKSFSVATWKRNKMTVIIRCKYVKGCLPDYFYFHTQRTLYKTLEARSLLEISKIVVRKLLIAELIFW